MASPSELEPRLGLLWLGEFLVIDDPQRLVEPGSVLLSGLADSPPVTAGGFESGLEIQQFVERVDGGQHGQATTPSSARMPAIALSSTMTLAFVLPS